MVIKLWNVSDWVRVNKDEFFVLPAPAGRENMSRKIRLEINPSWATRVTLVRPGHEFFHLAVVDRMETIEFWAAGEIKFSFSSALAGTDDVEAWVYTNDGQKTSTEIPDAETFTKIAERRARNPELEWMQYQMMQNIERRLEQQSLELERLYGANPETGEVDEGPQTDGDGADQGATGDGGDVSAGGQEPASSGSELEADPPAAKTAEKTSGKSVGTGTA